MTFTNQTALHGPTTSTKKRAALYLRVSGKQQEIEGYSLISQEDFCLSYCQEHNYTVDPLHIYREVHTGKVYRERPVLTEVRAAAKRREFDVLVVYELDRFARKQVHQAIVIDDLQHHGVAVESVKDPNDDSPQGQFLRSALGFVAEMEREKIVERTQRGKLTRVQSGKMLGQGVAAYGYEWADEKKTAYVINLVEAEIVRKLFDMIANGCSLHGLTRYLHTNSIPSPEGKAFWRKGTISRLLRNPYYIGKARAYKHTYIPRPGKSALRAERPEEEQIEMPEGVVPAIVSVETFEKVQRQLQINKERSTRNNRNPEATLLRGGIAVCGYCNGNLIVHRDTTRGKDEAYYRCQKSVHDADWHPEFGISTKTLDDAVWRRVVEVIRNPELVARTVEAQRKKDPTEAELEPINRRLQDLARKRKNYLRISESVQDDDTLDEISKQLNALDKEKRDTEHERDILLNRRSNWQGTEKRLEDFRLWCADMVEKLDNVSYDEKYRACEILGMKAVVWRRDHTPRYEITATPPEIMSHVTCNVKLNLLPLLTWND